MCRLEDLQALDALATEALALLQDLQEANSLLEAFDTMEILPIILGRASSCEQFLGWDAVSTSS